MLVKTKLKTKIFIDGGDPAETRQAKEMLGGWLDGQTTNPSLIAKAVLANSSGSITPQAAESAYRDTVQEMSSIIPQGSVSIQVFANAETSSTEMIQQAKERISWIPNASIKLPCTGAGLKAAEELCTLMPLNITLVFSQDQAAGVYEATKTATQPIFISPFVGRLDDKGEVGMDTVRNMVRLFNNGDGHVQVLTASVRTVTQIKDAIAAGTDIITIPFDKAFKPWADLGFELPGPDFLADTAGSKPIPYDELVTLGKDWKEYDLHHELTDKGLAAFWEDWNSLFA